MTITVLVLLALAFYFGQENGYDKAVTDLEAATESGLELSSCEKIGCYVHIDGFDGGFGYFK